MEVKSFKGKLDWKVRDFFHAHSLFQGILLYEDISILKT